MKVVIKKPGQLGEHADIPNELKDLQAAVGGYIEIVHCNADLVAIVNKEGKLKKPDLVAIVNEEGKLKQLPKNCCGLVGTIIFAGMDETTGDLTDIDPNFADMITDGYAPMMGGTCFVKGED